MNCGHGTAWIVVGFVVIMNLLLAVCPLDSDGTASDLVPVQTQVQKMAFELVNATAHQLSQAAIPTLLTLFDSLEFRNNISDVEMFWNQSAEFILSSLNQFVALSASTHGIPVSQASLRDVTLGQLEELDFLPNQFERVSLNILNASEPLAYQDLIIQNSAEIQLFKLPDFTTPLTSIPLNQSQNRVSYAALNMFRISTSSQAFGPVQLVLSPSYIRNMTVLSPFDTGSYSTCCILNQSSYCHILKCPAQVTLGTLSDFNHLYLQSTEYWGYPLSELVRRIFGPPLAIPGDYEGFYFEADVMGNTFLRGGIQYIIGDFTHLFGTQEESILRDWCALHQFPLVWSLGAAIVDNFYISEIASFNESFLDPYLLSSIANVTIDSQVLREFSTISSSVNATLNESPFLANSTEFWQPIWRSIYHELIPSILHFQYLKPPCTDSESCFGVDGDGKCICFNNSKD